MDVETAEGHEVVELAERLGPDGQLENPEPGQGAEDTAEPAATVEPGGPAEPSEDDDGQEPAPRQERPEPSPEQVAQAEQVMQLETAQANYEKRVRKIMGPDVPLTVCEACDGMGLVPPGGLEMPEFRQHAEYRPCDACAGYGQVLTGSKVPGSDIAKCPDCQGWGFLSRDTGHLPHEPAGESPQNGDGYGAPTWMGDPSIGRG